MSGGSSPRRTSRRALTPTLPKGDQTFEEERLRAFKGDEAAPYYQHQRSTLKHRTRDSSRGRSGAPSRYSDEADGDRDNKRNASKPRAPSKKPSAKPKKAGGGRR